MLQDSGWYKVNFSASSQLAFGYKQGCGFAENYCVDRGSGQPVSSAFCASDTTAGCSPDLLGHGTCGMSLYTSDLPTYYQYFSNPRRGGRDSLSDYCPVVYPNTKCNDLASCTSSKAEMCGGESVCMRANTFADGASGVSSSCGENCPRCYNLRCSSSGTVVGITVSVSGQQVDLPCSAGEVLVTNNITPHLFSPNNAYLTCPADSACEWRRAPVGVAVPEPSPNAVDTSGGLLTLLTAIGISVAALLVVVPVCRQWLRKRKQSTQVAPEP